MNISQTNILTSLDGNLLMCAIYRGLKKTFLPFPLSGTASSNCNPKSCDHERARAHHTLTWFWGRGGWDCPSGAWPWVSFPPTGEPRVVAVILDTGQIFAILSLMSPSPGKKSLPPRARRSGTRQRTREPAGAQGVLQRPLHYLEGKNGKEQVDRL